MSQPSDLSPDKQSSSIGFSINPLDIIKYLLSNWYWFVLTIALFGGYQWYRFATQEYQYTTFASVMFKDARGQARDAGLDRLASTAQTVNVANEILQFQSSALMSEAIWRLHAEVCYEVKDYLRIKELYSQAPIKVSFEDADKQQTLSLTATVKDDKTVILSDFVDGSKDLSVPFDKVVKSPYGNIKVSKTLFFTKDWYKQPIKVTKKNLEMVTGMMLSNLSITQATADESTFEKTSSVLNMSLRDDNPQRAADVLNMLINVYNEETVLDKNKQALNTSEFINDRLQVIEKELSEVESEVQQYKQANSMIDIGSEASTQFSMKQQYSTEAKDLQTQIKAGEMIRDYLNDPSRATDLIPTNMGVADAKVEMEIAQYNQTKLRRDKLLESSSEKNPVIEDLNKELTSMRQSIVRSVDNMNASTNIRLNDISSRAGAASARVAAVPRKQREMLSIERKQNIKQELYLYLLNKREENALNLATTASDARVIQPATVNENPVSASRNNMVAKGVLAGIALPTAVLLFFLFFDTRIKDRKDIEDATRIPFLGEIPKHKFKKDDKNRIVVLDNSRDIISEAFRIVRTNMNFMHVRSEKLQVVTFSSFGAGAGKTFVSSNIAASFAQTGKHTLIIDLDIRKGTLTNMTSHRGSRTTSYIIKGTSKPRKSFVPTEQLDHWYTIAALDVMASANTPCIAVLGNSITDGRGSTTNLQNRWTDCMAEAYEGKVAVLNEGIGGNAVLRGGLSEPAVKRFDRDIMSLRGVKTLVIFEGVNDIGGSRGNSEQVAAELIEAYKKFIGKAHGAGMKVYLATITPFQGNGYYTPFHEAARQVVNEWIRTNKEADGVIDFDEMVKNPQKPTALKEEYSDDWLHLNPTGYEAMGRYAASIIK